jgi:hypothetical protein
MQTVGSRKFLGACRWVSAGEAGQHSTAVLCRSTFEKSDLMGAVKGGGTVNDI